MLWLLQTSITAALAFGATNLDDLVVLTLFFSQVGQTLRPRQIVIGQYLGFAVLLLLSLPGYLGGRMIARPWIGLLGILPILIGLRALRPTDDEEPAPTIQAVNLGALTHPLPQRFDSAQRWQNWRWQNGLKSPVFQVAAVTFANGGDNIGIYLPLFAKSNGAELCCTLVIFLGLVAVWCRVAAMLANRSAFLSRYSHRLVPWVLMGLGVMILWESQSWLLLWELKRD
jgi:cadmium resistance protein CadD (predicted permease)